MNMCVRITIAMARLSFAVEGLWNSWDSIMAVAMVTLLREAFNFICCFVEPMH
jgi:hypothetical protein